MFVINGVIKFINLTLTLLSSLAATAAAANISLPISTMLQLYAFLNLAFSRFLNLILHFWDN
jgi:hypothetical protein